jgi:hypothetical protein
MAAREAEQNGLLPPDNVARLAIYDVVHEATKGETEAGLTDTELFDRVIGRLRFLVPRELHLAGERSFVEQKVSACIEMGILAEDLEHGRRLRLTGSAPTIRYPDGELRDYVAGLEPALERLDADNSRLRSAGFDVRALAPSAADDRDGARFQALLKSMREHGFMKRFPLVSYEQGIVIDGRARLQAARELGMEPEYLRYASERDRKDAERRDTPLGRVLEALDANAGRLSEDVVEAVHAGVSAVTRRKWDRTDEDLRLTAQWRLAKPPVYSPFFEVEKLAYRAGDEAKVQSTADEKVMLRSLLEAASLSNYKIKELRDFVPFERARTSHSAGRKAIFARASDLVEGIAAMQSERRATKLKVDPEWEQIRRWLLETFGTGEGDSRKDA